MGSKHPYPSYPMGIRFCPITYPLVENSFHTHRFIGKNRRVLGFRVPHCHLEPSLSGATNEMRVGAALKEVGGAWV